MSKAFRSSTARIAAILVVVAAVAVAWRLSSGVREPDVSSYYPLEVGNSWSYETKQYGKMVGPNGVEESEKFGTLEQRVLGASRLSSEQLKVFAVRQTTEERVPDGTSSPAVESVLHVSATPNAISLQAVEVEGSESPSLPAPVPILTDPPSEDEIVTSSGTVQVLITVQSQGVEAVEVPAGTYPKALKKVAGGPVTGKVSGVPVSSGSMTETTWFVRDVGIVKQERRFDMLVQGPAGTELRIEERSQRDLTKYTAGTAN